MSDRHAEMGLLWSLMEKRFDIKVPGDEIYWHEESEEARVEWNGITWFASTQDGQPACGPIITCKRCGKESAWRVDLDDLDVLDEILDNPAFGCDCQHETQLSTDPFDPFSFSAHIPTRYLIAVVIIAVTWIWSQRVSSR